MFLSVISVAVVCCGCRSWQTAANSIDSVLLTSTLHVRDPRSIAT